jgi:hypothetical protein
MAPADAPQVANLPPGDIGRRAVFAHDNAQVAYMLREMASLLEAQGDNAFRVAAYRRAADTVAALARGVRAIFEAEGVAGLDALPTIGSGIAAAIAEIASTGRWSRLDRLRGEAGVEAVFHTIPGVGMTLAHRLHDELDVDSLEALEVAAHDGRLERLAQVGPRRAAAIRAALTQMLDRTRALRRARSPAAPAAPAVPAVQAVQAVQAAAAAARAAPAAAAAPAAPAAPATAAAAAAAAPAAAGAPGPAPAADGPGVDLLLDVDRDYRDGAAAGRLPTIAPRRFNPEGKAWLPVLHKKHGDWHFTALFSNTARAHELGRVHDWVVIYAEDRDHQERQYTVVTPPGGPLAGRRVVRGREAECRAWYAAQ